MLLSSDGKLFISRHVLFNEATFSFATSSSPSTLPNLFTHFHTLSLDSSAPTWSGSVSLTTPNQNPSSHILPSIPPTLSDSSLNPSREKTCPPSLVVSNSHSIVTRGKVEILKFKAYVVDYVELEPASVKEALLHEHWRHAMDKEYNALIKNHTLDLVPKPQDKQIVGCK